MMFSLFATTMTTTDVCCTSEPQMKPDAIVVLNLHILGSYTLSVSLDNDVHSHERARNLTVTERYHLPMMSEM